MTAHGGWELFDGQSTFGPITEDAVIEMLRAGRAAHVLVRAVGTEQWRSLDTHAPFAYAVQSAQPTAESQRRPSGALGAAASRQGLVIAAFALLGAIACFLPWLNVPIVGSLAGVSGVFGWSAYGWVCLWFFVVAAALGGIWPFFGASARVPGIAAAVCAGIAGATGAWRMVDLYLAVGRPAGDSPFANMIANSVSVGFGLYLVVAAGIAVPLVVGLVRPPPGSMPKASGRGPLIGVGAAIAVILTVSVVQLLQTFKAEKAAEVTRLAEQSEARCEGLTERAVEFEAGRRTFRERVESAAEITQAYTDAEDACRSAGKHEIAQDLRVRNDKVRNGVEAVRGLVPQDDPQCPAPNGMKGTGGERYYFNCTGGPCAPVSLANFSELQDGMDLERVQRILGRGEETSSSSYGNMTMSTLSWKCTDAGRLRIITVTLRNGRLTSKMQVGLD